MLLFKSKLFIGLDFAASEIRLMKLKQSKLSIVVEKNAVIDLPEGAMEEGKIKQSEVVAAKLKETVQVWKIRKERAAFALPSHHVISKKLKLPNHLTEDECEIEIGEHLNQYLPGEKDEYYFDFVILKKGLHQEIHLYAAKKEEVDLYRNVIHQSGLILRLIDVDHYARERAVQWVVDHPTGISPDFLVCLGAALRSLSHDRS